MSTKPEVRYGISEAARLLDRSCATLRAWERKESMPKRLRPKRDAAGRRYWSPQLIDQIKLWIEENNFYPGRGIAYKPTPAQARQHVEKIRKEVRSRHNGHADSALDEFAEKVREAVESGRPVEEVVSAFPIVAATLGISLSEAMAVGSEVLSSLEAAE